MSVYGALYSGVSGLAANSNALGMIADNISNVNTVGYKATEAQFTTLATDSTNASYAPGGVKAQSHTLIDQDGLLQASEFDTDLGIKGAGFFVVSDSSEDNVQSTNISFTRAGSFFPDDQGYLHNSAGLYLKGWPIDENGDIPNNRGDLSTLQTVRVSGLTGTAAATTKVSLRANLQSSQPVNPAAGTYDPADPANNMEGGGVTPDFEQDMQIYDAQGSSHTVTMAMMKSAPNTWQVELYVQPAGDVTTPSGQIAAGTLAFNTDGSLNLGATSPALKSAISIPWTNGAGTSNVTYNWGTDGQEDGVTQKDSESTVISKSINGAVFGNVTGVEIGTDGVVTAKFDNGLVKDVYQLPIATFQNPNGLERQSGNSYTQSDQSGAFTLQTAGAGGAGKIAPSMLEASTVDLASEFSNLITTQRAYSASTKVITTADEMLDELNNMKR